MVVVRVGGCAVLEVKGTAKAVLLLVVMVVKGMEKEVEADEEEEEEEVLVVCIFVVVVVVDVVEVVVAHFVCARVMLPSGKAGSRLPLHGQSFFGLVSAQTSICMRTSVPPHSFPSVLAQSPHPSV